MSTPILPFAVWASGTNQNSIPANDNSLRNQILNGLVISDSVTAEPALTSPADDGAIYIIPAGATGTQWATFDEFDLTIFVGGTWYAFAPVEGVVVNLAGALVSWDGAAYVDVGGGAVTSVNGQTGVVSLEAADIPITDAGGYFSSTDVEGALQELGAGGGGGGGYGNAVVQTISGTTYTATAADGGNSATSPSRFNVFTNTSAKSATFDPESTTALPANGEWYFYNQGASTLTIIAGSGVIIVRPGGGALTVASGDAVVVKRLAADSFLVLP